MKSPREHQQAAMQRRADRMREARARGETYTVIAARFGVSRQRVQQILAERS